MNKEKQPELIRAIGRWSLTALVVNAIIGAGIFGLPSIAAGLLGAASPFAYLLASAGTGVILACFAEVASRFRDAGGPYLYARQAFGPFVGILMGWLTWLVRLTAAGANANLFVIYLAEFWPQATSPITRLGILSVLVGLLAVINYRGVSGGVRLSDFFAIVKVLPLLAFIGFGLFYVSSGAPETGFSPSGGDWIEAVLILVYAYGGYEAALIPLGEAKHPRRDVPFALFTGLAVVTLLYTFIQVVVINILPAAEQTDRPLAEAARQVLGSPGAVFITIAALISVYGYLSSMMLNCPRLSFAMAERGDFPTFLAYVHKRFHTPHLSIVFYALLVWMLAVAGSFRWNVTISAIARLFTYAIICASLVAFRKKKPGEATFRLPAGPLFAGLGIAFTLILLSRMGQSELQVILATVSIALANWAWVRRPSRL